MDESRLWLDASLSSKIFFVFLLITQPWHLTQPPLELGRGMGLVPHSVQESCEFLSMLTPVLLHWESTVFVSFCDILWIQSTVQTQGVFIFLTLLMVWLSPNPSSMLLQSALAPIPISDYYLLINKLSDSLTGQGSGKVLLGLTQEIGRGTVHGAHSCCSQSASTHLSILNIYICTHNIYTHMYT